jgi:hypothetical protein
MRPRQTRRLLALMAFGAILAGTGVGWGVSEAHADAGTDYAADHAATICSVLDQYPTIGGIAGIGQAIVEEGELSFREAGEAIGVSVAVVCPWHQPIVDAFIARYAPAQPGYVA